MKVVSYNPDAPKRNSYECHVCGNRYYYDNEFRFIERPSKNWIGEEDFIICSKGCREKMHDSYITWLTTRMGWSAKDAEDNYAELVKNRD